MTGQTKKVNKHERYFFDIPVFRCEREKWNKELENKKAKLAQNIAGVGKKVTEKELSYSESWLRSDWSAYYYSEMIGMIRLYAMNQQIRAELFFINNKRITRNLKNSKWKYFGKLFEFMIFDTHTNESIFDLILKRLEENKTDLLKNRFIDLEAFSNSGNYIDYKKLVNF